MTNREKYAEQIIDMALDSIEIAVDKEGKLCDCNVIRCSDCAWSSKSRCRERFKEWAKQEYVESTVDWSKVPVDTKVYVRDSDSDPWKPRYFAKFEGGKIFTPYECQKAVYRQRVHRKDILQSERVGS
mgnify:CR=1 FL=1